MCEGEREWEVARIINSFSDWDAAVPTAGSMLPTATSAASKGALCAEGEEAACEIMYRTHRREFVSRQEERERERHSHTQAHTHTHVHRARHADSPRHGH